MDLWERGLQGSPRGYGRRRKGPPGRAGPPPAARRRTRLLLEYITTQYCPLSFGRTSIEQLTGRGEGVYGITLVPLAEELRAADSGMLSLFYGDDAAFDGSEREIAQLLKLLTERGPNHGYLPEPAKYLFISETPGHEEAVKREFGVEGLVLKFESGSRYLGDYLGPQEELEAWVKPQVEAWAHRVRVLGKISRRQSQTAYAGLGMLLKLKWQYLKRTVPRVGTPMGPIEEALREKIFPALFGGEEIDSNFRQILGHSVKHGGLGIPDPQISEESAYKTSKVASGELVDSLLGVSALNYVGHRACVHGTSLAGRRERKHVELAELARRKDLAGGQERNRLQRATRNGAWFSAVPHRINSTELSQEKFRDNLRLRYGLMPQDIPTTCDGCGKRFSIE